MDNIRPKLIRLAFTNARRLVAPGIGIFASLNILACSADSPGKQPGQADSVAADSISRAAQDSVNRTLPGYVVDSILPVQEELRRFRKAVGGEEVFVFEYGAPSRDSLVKEFIYALSVQDSVTLKKLLLSAGEFAWLVYPESPYTTPPYTQAPSLVWTQIQNPAQSGFTRLVRRIGGTPLRFAGYDCSANPDRQGQNLIWTKCIVRVAAPGEALRNRRLFGSIIERDGRFKFVSYANEF